MSTSARINVWIDSVDLSGAGRYAWRVACRTAAGAGMTIENQ